MKLSNNMNNITKIVLYFSFVILAAWLADAKTNYCKKGLCHSGKHIACHHNNLFDKKCPSDAKLVDITPALKNLIVDKFNEKRDFVAGGNVRKLRPACRMATMKWDDELAKLAELNVKQCKMNHDSCHNTKSYHTSGQNLAWMTFSGAPNDTDNLSRSVDMWYDEVQFIEKRIMKKFPMSRKGPAIGHFTAMVWDRNVAVGCAASTYSIKGKSNKSYLVACNMAYTNMVGSSVYKTCRTPGSKCKTGKNPKFKNLCSKSEKYNVNGY